MTTDDKNILAQKINQEFERFCDQYDEWCTKCPYIKCEMHCEIAFTLSYLNKRGKLKEVKK